jgi:hypothetical protein
MNFHDEEPTFASLLRAQKSAKPSLNNSDGLPAEGIAAAFQFAELRQVRWQLANSGYINSPYCGRRYFRSWHRADIRAQARRQARRNPALQRTPD